MTQDILVYCEQNNGAFRKAAIEALSKASETASLLGGKAVAVVIGAGAAAIAPKTGEHGAARAIVIENDALKNFTISAYGQVMAEAAKKVQPFAVFLPATTQGKDLGGALSAALETGVAADCTALKIEGGKLVVTKPVYSGKTYATVEFASSPAILSLRPNVFPAAPAKAGAVAQVEKLDLAITPRETVKEILPTGGGKKTHRGQRHRQRRPRHEGT